MEPLAKTLISTKLWWTFPTEHGRPPYQIGHQLKVKISIQPRPPSGVIKPWRWKVKIEELECMSSTTYTLFCWVGGVGGEVVGLEITLKLRSVAGFR